jgi:MFS family permease
VVSHNSNENAGPAPAAPRYAGLRPYLAANALASVAAEMQSVAIGWQVYQLTGSFAQLGFVGLAQFAPFILLVLPAGHFADRHDRGRIATACFGAQALGSALLFMCVYRGLSSMWLIYLVLALFGSARAFAMPAGSAMVVNLVPAAGFARATAASSSIREAAGIAGPVLGGVLYLLGPEVVYGCAFALLFGAALAMARVHPRRTHGSPAGGFSWQNVLAGLDFIRSRPLVLGAISLDLVAVLLGGCGALLPAYAKDVLHVGPQALGLLRTAPAVGAVACGTLLALLPLRRRVGRWLFAGVTVFGIGTVVFALSQSLWLSLACLVVLGAGDMISVYIRGVLIQGATPDALRGRVGAVNAMFIGASAELGEFESGMLASAVGLVPSVVLGGCATLVVLALWARLFPELRRADEFPAQPAL